MKSSRPVTFQLAVLLLALAGAAACGSDDSVSDTPVDRAKDPPRGGKTDAGATKDGGKGAPVNGGQGKAPNDEPSACEKLQLPANPNSPQILIVLDRSGSMVGIGGGSNTGKNRWQPSVRAVKTLTASLTSTVEFGLMLFPSPGAGGGGGGGFPSLGGFGGGGGGGGAGCAAGQVDVAVNLDTADEIASMLDRSAPDIGQTPTAVSLQAAQEALRGGCADCVPKPKYVLLVTDGQPTCGSAGIGTTQADIDATNAAIDALSEDEIKTYVIGYDTLPGTPEGDVMQSFAEHGGTEKYYPVEDEASLVAELTRIASALVPCEFELKEEITNPDYIRVQIDGKTYLRDANWSVEGNKIVLDPMGEACPLLRDAQVHLVSITRECEAVVGI